MQYFICSFCGKREGENSDILITGKTGAICGTCARQVAIMSKREQAYQQRIGRGNAPSIQWRNFKPHLLKAHLDEYVVGQEEAKKVLSVAVYNHYKRLQYLHDKRPSESDVEIEKSNIIMIGETGVGKTYLIKIIAKKLQVPFCIADATALTQAGYVGEDVENMLVRLLQAAGHDIETAECGIIYLDEVDKIARKGENMSITRDVSGEGVQQALLKMIEGSDVRIAPDGGRKHADQKLITLNTQNILFILGGAFDGIHNVIKRRLRTTTIGFRSEKNNFQDTQEGNLIRYVNGQDLKDYGIIPELVGRLPVIVHLNPLTRDMLREIIARPKNALLKQYEKLFAMEGIQLTFTTDAMDYIVDKVLEQKLGARGLRGILEKVLTEPMFELSTQKQNKLTIDRDYVADKLLHNKPTPRPTPTRQVAH